jgi:hypothetical protein
MKKQFWHAFAPTLLQVSVFSLPKMEYGYMYRPPLELIKLRGAKLVKVSPAFVRSECSLGCDQKNHHSTICEQLHSLLL